MTTLNSSTQVHHQLVAGMNIAFGNPKGDLRSFLPTSSSYTNRTFDELAWAKLLRQCFNIKSEINEFKAAVADNDQAEARDALCDIRVFAHGGAHFMGYDLGGQNIYDMPLSLHEANHYSFVSLLTPFAMLDAAFAYLTSALNTREWSKVEGAIRLMLYATDCASQYLGLTAEDTDRDMQEVISKNMTRFVKSPADLEDTIAYHGSSGVTSYYTEGNYPTMVFKSAVDQPDAPKGKFLKSASYEKPVFPPLDHVDVSKANV